MPINHPPPIVTLLTDFGEHDGYVGAMKGVILSILPHVKLVDISHQILSQDIQQASTVLAGVYQYYPPHTVHLVIVDPGVGGTRQPIAVETPSGIFVAPDNGVLTPVYEQEESWRAVKLDRPAYWLAQPSHTFHGRDIFSPVAAHLAGGISLSQIGSDCQQVTRLQQPRLALLPGAVQGEVVRIDRFGNALTNIRHLRWVDDDMIEFIPMDAKTEKTGSMQFKADTVQVTFGWHTLKGIYQTYSHVSVGQAVALIGSGGELEISVNRGSAREKLALSVGVQVKLLLNH
nr:SAM-dependent chlorinase/fluorinase [Anaerolineae bacterium]